MTITSEKPSVNNVIDYAYWTSQLEGLKQKYMHAAPYPHIVLENFLNAQFAKKLHSDFPEVQKTGWINYVHYNEKKFGKNDLSEVSDSIMTALAELNSPKFMDFLKGLTGIKDLFPDKAYEGGGLHQTLHGGFLNIHADFTVHPHHRDWRRRVNVLVYLNPDWHEEYGGHLELWDNKMKACHSRILPIFNRAVIFNTDHDSFHGQPDPLTCPETESRKSLALYYFSKDPNAIVKTTNYRARPGDGFKRVLIAVDKVLLNSYDWVKRKSGLNDDFASKWLGRFGRFKDKLSRK